MSDLPSSSEPHYEASAPRRALDWVKLLVGALVVVFVTATATLVISERSNRTAYGPESSDRDPHASSSALRDPLHLAFGSHNKIIDSVTIPSGSNGASLLLFDVRVVGTAASRSRAAMVSFRVDCYSKGGNVEMQADGKVSANVFLARGGLVSGQALTEPAEMELKCNLLASAPFIEPTDDGLTFLPLRADMQFDTRGGLNLHGLHWLNDATLLEPGDQKNVLSRQIDAPARVDQMNASLRLTSCTVVGGSRDAGANKCESSMTGRESSSTVRIRVVARWLDAEGKIESTSTYWDETLAIDYNTHHVPWNLRLSGMTDQVEYTASAVVLVLQVEAIAGTPFVVHADGTDVTFTIHT